LETAKKMQQKRMNTKSLFKSIRRFVDFATLDAVTRAVVRDRLTYLSYEKLKRIRRALAEIKDSRGDIIEFGVDLGGSGIILARRAGASRRFIGFDVFGMIPPPTSEKDDTKSKERYEVISSGKSQGLNGDVYYGYKKELFKEVTESFARHGVPVDWKRIFLYQGLFETTWPAADETIDAIALAHIDCDWYDPVLFCLNACADKLVEGGILIIDDYNDYGGCRTAVDEFVSKRTDFRLEPGANPFLRKCVSLEC
jgi:asparagine synthase (glutamine-hydrolysing)